VGTINNRKGVYMSIKKSQEPKEKYLYPDMGLRIKEIRGKLTQGKLAEIIGVNQGTIGKYEKGMMLAGDKLIRLSEHAKKSPQWILRGSEENVKAMDQATDGTHNQPMQLNGSNHHIDIYHGDIANDPTPNYTPALSTLKGIAETLPDKRLWDLIKIAAGMKSEEE
jgi:DNA-binding XRE family transcriptional regulator